MIIKVCLPSGDRMDVIIMLIASPAMAEHNSPANFQLMITSNETIIKLGYMLLLSNLLLIAFKRCYLYIVVPQKILWKHTVLWISLLLIRCFYKAWPQSKKDATQENKYWFLFSGGTFRLKSAQEEKFWGWKLCLV